MQFLNYSYCCFNIHFIHLQCFFGNTIPRSHHLKVTHSVGSPCS
uniref:Uncharacterized protein n=1 Tax=Rhizophora mucronata TaxID=61149 RepID=A0A2P2PHQ7_RHIMU